MGIHLTSTFDLALVMCAAIILCTTTGIKFFVTLCQITYFVTFAYDIGAMLLTEPQSFDSLVISRSMLHVLLILTVGFLARIIIDRWMQVLEASKEEVEHLTDATARLNDFLTNVSHEIRTPINTIIGFNEMILREDVSDEVAEDAANIQAAGKMLLHLINDILDMSKLESGNMKLSCAPYRIDGMLSELVNMFWSRARGRRGWTST
ncbi:MAG: hypothetical protein K6G17_07540 [Oscillospiraceae bacterium]|nr:hypothetical protein [Oscillospiraceae bacterium]